MAFFKVSNKLCIKSCLSGSTARGTVTILWTKRNTKMKWNIRYKRQWNIEYKYEAKYKILKSKELHKILLFRLNGNGYRKSIETILWIKRNQMFVETETPGYWKDYFTMKRNSIELNWHNVRCSDNSESQSLNDEAFVTPQVPWMFFVSIATYLGKFGIISIVKIWHLVNNDKFSKNNQSIWNYTVFNLHSLNVLPLL